MWRFLKNFIAVPLVLGTIVLTAWAFGRQYLSEAQLAATPAQVMDQALYMGNTYAAPILSPFKKLLRPVLGRFFRQDYTRDILTVTAADLERILQEAQRRNFRAVVIYFYCLDTAFCTVNYNDVNNIASGFDRKKLLTLGIAVGVTPQALSDHFNITGGLPNFKPFLLKPGEEGKVAGLSALTDSGFAKPPYVAILNETGRLFNMPSGFGRGEAMAAKVYDFVK